MSAAGAAVAFGSLPLAQEGPKGQLSVKEALEKLFPGVASCQEVTDAGDCLNKLTPQQRYAVVGVVQGGNSLKRMADEMGVLENDVRLTVSTGLDRLEEFESAPSKIQWLVATGRRIGY